MRILIQGYNTCHQNIAGGVAGRILSLINALENNGVQCKIFDYWNDKIEDYDLVHFFKVQSDHFALGDYLQFKKKPYIISTIIPNEKKLWIQANCILNRINIHTLIGRNKVFMDNASCLLAESFQEKQYIHSAYGIELSKIKIIPNGVQCGELVNEGIFLDKYHLKSGFVLCVGRIDPNKNQLNLIKALNNTDLQLVIVGGPDPQHISYYEECKKVAASNVLFTGWISPASDMLKAAYLCAKVVVLPSFNETFGNVILEGAINNANISYSSKLPINDWGLGRYAFTFDPRNLEDIRNAVISAYNSNVNVQLAEYVRAHFSWDSVAKAHITLYKQFV